MIPENIRKIKISDFNFAFTDELIAQQPLINRDESKLLHYKNSIIHHRIFKEFPELLNSNSQIILNNAKVISARLFFYRDSGSKIEILLLEPHNSFNSLETALSNSQKSMWKCMIGNLKKWKKNEILKSKVGKIAVSAKLLDNINQTVEFTWDNNVSFSEIIELSGTTPLPPYIKREANENDKKTYQTIFAKNIGAVAAPTAGLHFTENILDKIKDKKIDIAEVTLYVSAGTFLPVKAEFPIDHSMHSEMISVSKNTISNLINNKYRVAIGTTSLRTLESLYWIGVKILKCEENPFYIEKLYPYNFYKLPISWNESMSEIINYLEKNSIDTVNAKTEIMIMPGYNFSSVNSLLTNFHYPNSTLVMLIAAFIGDNWHNLYHKAIENSYRFLSYGDCCLLDP
ncbi:MAG: S-adenosylmethionine:tRNA ribosyltransferase-isomerase [Bacteroidia bacterium]|nr:S-adenosylmethionine:tRNA ribosyltransferase-isomerase [Bacteroidia bacterium]